MKKPILKNNSKISYRTIPEMVATTLREAILAGELAGGEQIKQELLASQLGVSMSPLREALKLLESEGLVKFFPNRGVMVTELSAAEAKEIFDIRMFLELGALELAIPNLTKEDIEQASKIIKQIDLEACNGQWSQMNWKFHEILYLPARSPRLLNLIMTLHNNVERYMHLYLFTMNYQAKSQNEHKELLNACAEKDVAAAKVILREHMIGASEVLINYLNQAKTNT